MKLTTTVVAAIFALIATAITGLLLEIPTFQVIEGKAGDELMKLRYQIEQRLGHAKPDPRLVLIAIDDRSAQELGQWPFPRSTHGQLLQLLAPEAPRTVAWDILFTESSGGSTQSSPPPPANSVTPPPASTEQPTSPASAAPAPSSNITAASTNATPAPSAIAPADTASGAPASAPAAATPAAPPSATPAAATPQPPPAAPLSEDDQFLQGVSPFPHMVTGAANEGLTPLKPQDALPTRPLPHVTGDISPLSGSPYAIVPFTGLRKQSYFGFVDSPGEVRRTMPLVINVGGQIYPSFDLQVLLQYWGVDPDQVTVNIGRDVTIAKPDGSQIQIPIDDKGEIAVNYRAHLQDFQNISYVGLGIKLDRKQSHPEAPPDPGLPPLKGNIVIFGVTIAGTDAGPNPLDQVAPLVVTHLNALNDILQQNYLHLLNKWIGLPLFALFLFLVANALLRAGTGQMVPITLGAVVLLAVVALGTLTFANVLMPVAVPEVGLLLIFAAVPTKRYFGEEKEKLRIKQAMSASLSEKIMNHILAHPDNVKLGGVKQEITVMFCDIRNFTSYCDTHDPVETIGVINEYMETMTQVVFKYDGTIDKYIGDCIMAFWNAPQPQPDHAQRAVCCAMEMRYALANFKTKRAGIDIELFECGIGIHTGEALVGNMGSSLKVNYTVMGSTVNMGARLETLTKRLNERIIISQATLDQLQGDFPLTDRGEAAIPGFAQPIHVYAVVADQDISAALSVGKTLAGKLEYTAEEVQEPMWEPAPLPKDADPDP